MAHLRFVEGVRLNLASPAIAAILWGVQTWAARDEVQAALAPGTDVTITSGCDREHSRNPLSRHYTDEALDLRVHNLAEDARERLRGLLEAVLNHGREHLIFRVLHENVGTPNEHLHCQVRQGMRFPGELAPVGPRTLAPPTE